MGGEKFMYLMKRQQTETQCSIFPPQADLWRWGGWSHHWQLRWRKVGIHWRWGRGRWEWLVAIGSNAQRRESSARRDHSGRHLVYGLCLFFLVDMESEGVDATLWKVWTVGNLLRRSAAYILIYLHCWTGCWKNFRKSKEMKNKLAWSSRSPQHRAC